MKQKKFYSTQLLLLAAIALFFSCGSKKQASHYSVQDETVKNSLNTKLPVGRYRVPREHFAAYSLP